MYTMLLLYLYISSSVKQSQICKKLHTPTPKMKEEKNEIPIQSERAGFTSSKCAIVNT